MQEFKLYIDTLKRIIDNFYEKEIVFYDEFECKWYSRIHCKNITPEELTEWALELIKQMETKIEHYEEKYEI